MSKLIQFDPCPLCVADGRDTSGDNLGVYDDGHTYCFAGHGLVNKGSEVFDLTGFTYEYLPWRNIPKDIMAFYDVKTKVDPEGKPLSIGFKWPNGVYQIRDLDQKNFHGKPGEKTEGLFGRDKFSAGQSRYVTVTEGAIDALSFAAVLRRNASGYLRSEGEYTPTGTASDNHPPVVAVQSSSTAVRDCTVDRSFLDSFERIYLAFDNDEPGRQALHQVARLFDYNKVFHVQMDKRKDGNEYLQAGEGDELRRIWWNSKQYVPHKILSTKAEFSAELRKPKKLGVPYPFPTLTEMTYGMRTGETVLIKAPEKVGKTALMHALQHQLLKRTDDNVAAIFLEEAPDRHLQSLYGIELQKPLHLPDVDFTEAEEDRVFEEVIRRDGRLNVYPHFGSDDPRVLLDLVRFLVTSRACRWVLFDHISMVSSGSFNNMDERKGLDYLSTRLEMMVKELDFGLIVVSHVNDEGKTRGSRWLTKIADIVIDLERDGMAEDLATKNTLRVSIPYNRFCSKTGRAGDLFFNPVTYTYSEVSNASEAHSGHSGWPSVPVAP